jgi:hypothetical protein
MAQKGVVECAVMCCPVFGDQASAINHYRDRQILRSNVVNNLIVRALQKGTVHSYDRP